MGIINSILETLKLLAETITAITAAVITIVHLHEKKVIKRFFTITIPTFFHGITTIDGKKVRFIKALNEAKRKRELIVNAIAPNREDEYLLNKDELEQFLLDNKIFTKVTR